MAAEEGVVPVGFLEMGLRGGWMEWDRDLLRWGGWEGWRRC